MTPAQELRTVARKYLRRQRVTGPMLISAVMVLLVGAIWLSEHPMVLITGAVLAAAAAVGFVYFKMNQAQRRTIAPYCRRPAMNYLQLSPTQFEHAIADLCRRDGCTQVKVVGGAGDLAADVLFTTPDGRRMLIQAKRYGKGNSVGSPEVQKVGGTYTVIHGAALAAVVTTSHFTPAAIDYARRAGIGLLDGQRLARWASKAGPAPWN